MYPIRGGLAIDPREFRNALGQFATGVTIITAAAADGSPLGVTVSSFNSVSLDPPLVLWSLDNRAFSRAHFEAAGHFVVHVLSLEQRELAMRFATRGAPKFDGLEWRRGTGGAPVLAGCAARFECATRNCYAAGDHLLFVGEVLHFEHSPTAPLMFHAGTLGARPVSRAPAADALVDVAAGRFGPEFICYLTARTHFQVYRPLTHRMAELGISEAEYFTLSALSIRNGLAVGRLAQFLEHTGHAPTDAQLAAMAERGLVTRTGSGESETVGITAAGREKYALLLARDGELAERALAGFAPDEVDQLASFLRRLISNTDPGVLDLWAAES